MIYWEWGACWETDKNVSTSSHPNKKSIFFFFVLWIYKCFLVAYTCWQMYVHTNASTPVLNSTTWNAAAPVEDQAQALNYTELHPLFTLGKKRSNLPSCPRRTAGHGIAELLSSVHRSCSCWHDLPSHTATEVQINSFKADNSTLGLKNDSEHNCNIKVAYKGPFLQSNLFISNIYGSFVTTHDSLDLKMLKGYQAYMARFW